MSNNSLKKMIVFSDEEVREHIEIFLKTKANEENQSQSKIAEECILQVMTISGDKWAGEKLIERYKRNADFLRNLEKFK